MKNDLKRAGYIKKLEWAIWLSQVKLQELREGDWLNLREELHDFGYDEPIPSDFGRQSFLKKATPQSIEAIQRDLINRFDQCVKMYSDWKLSGSPREAVFGISPFDAKVHLIASTPDLSFHLTIRSEDL